MEIKLNEMIEVKENEDIDPDADIEIFEWAVEDGAAVKSGDALLEAMFGKTSVKIAAPADGTVKILVEEGEIVSGDDVIAEIA